MPPGEFGDGLCRVGIVVNRILPDDTPADGFLAARRDQQAAYLDRIDQVFAGQPQIRLPLLASDVNGREALATVAGHLIDGFGRA